MHKAVVDQLITMRHSPLHNYIVPGLTSWLIMDQGGAGKVRMFENTREQHHFVTPHSHRFNFSACVVRGWVENTSWFLAAGNQFADEFCVTAMKYDGTPGQYVKESTKVDRYMSDSILYQPGANAWYSMRFHEIHSIKFSKDAIVLFFEGPAVTDSSFILEPVVDGHHIPTMRTEPWMFIKGESK